MLLVSSFEIEDLSITAVFIVQSALLKPISQLLLLLSHFSEEI